MVGSLAALMTNMIWLLVATAVTTKSSCSSRKLGITFADNTFLQDLHAISLGKSKRAASIWGKQAEFVLKSQRLFQYIPILSKPSPSSSRICPFPCSCRSRFWRCLVGATCGVGLASGVQWMRWNGGSFLRTLVGLGRYLLSCCCGESRFLGLLRVFALPLLLIWLIQTDTTTAMQFTNTYLWIYANGDAYED